MGEYPNPHWRQNCSPQDQPQHVHAPGKWRTCIKCEGKHVRVFGTHFDKVLNNHRPEDRSVLDLLEQKPCMTPIDNPISFTEFKRAINKLKKVKAPGLNGIPPEAHKAMDDVS